MEKLNTVIAPNYLLNLYAPAHKKAKGNHPISPLAYLFSYFYFSNRLFL